MAPSKLEETRARMDKFVVIVKEDDKMSDPLAFVLKRDSLVGDSYRMFLCSRDKELEDYLYVHESGHIIFGHAEPKSVMETMLLSRMAQLFYEDRFLSTFNSKEEFVSYIKDYLFNIAMDFEVNSKLFSDDDIKRMSELMGSSPYYPREFSYDDGLSWREYLDLMLDDKRFFSKDKRKKGSQTDEEYVSKLKREAESVSQKSKERRAARIESSEAKNLGIQPGSSSETSGKTESEGLSFDELKKTIVSNVFNMKVVSNKRDMMYNANRRKLGESKILVPKTLQWTEIRADSFIVLFDVSGSVSSDIISKSIAMFKDISSKVGKDSRLVCWNTELVDDSKLRLVDDVNIGGGTDIADGIAYCSHYLHSGTKLFVISDFIDDLDAWDEELAKLKTKSIYGICWDKASYRDYASKMKCFKRIWCVE